MSNVINVARNFNCDRDTAELGEDFPELRKIERAYRLLESRIANAARKVHSARATASVMLMEEGLADVRHDASFGATLSLAADAFAEARVTPTIVKRRVA